jgi:cysteine desulfurase/selenocysteine lyase
VTTPPPRRYLDHPATSWPKPAPVIESVMQAIRDVGAAAGRGTFSDARRADAIRAAARTAAARLIGAVDPDRVALPAGATLGLNMAIHGIVEPGWHVIATAADHNATLRPLHWLERQGTISLTVVPCDELGIVEPADIAAAWRPDTRLVVFSHASNVTGALQDAEAIVGMARDRGAITILDAAQTAGIVAVPSGESAPDVVVAPAHKWIQGPEGIAILFVRAGIEPRPLVQGGTGSGSDAVAMPEKFGDRMEAGTPDLGALAGLAAAIGWGERHGIAPLAAHGRALAASCRAGLAALPGVHVLGTIQRTAPPIVSFTVDGYDPAVVAVLLEQAAGVQARAGFHCAALVHRHLGTASGGTVRVGFGPFNTPDDASAVVTAIAAITGSATLGGPDGPAGAFPASSPPSTPIDWQVPPWQA